jgi:transposase-like protein
MRTVATELGISNETLRSWIKQADIDEGRREGLSRQCR